MTGFSDSTRAVIVEREAGICALHHNHAGTQIHHRRPRGLGGSRRPSTNSVSNGLLFCQACHDWVERNRTAALMSGWLVPQEAEPAEVPVRYRGVWVWLDDDGGLNLVDDGDV